MDRLRAWCRRNRNPKEKGQALAEYAFILLLVAVACVVAATLMGTTVQGLYNGFNGSF